MVMAVMASINIFSRSGSRCLCRPVHAQDEVVDLRPIAHHAQAFFQRTQIVGHENLDFRIGEIAVRAPGDFDRLLGADLKSLLQTRGNLGVAQLASQPQLPRNVAHLGGRERSS